MVKRLVRFAVARLGPYPMQIIDLRQLSSWQLEPLLAEEVIMAGGAAVGLSRLRGTYQKVCGRAFPYRLRRAGKWPSRGIYLLCVGRPQRAGRWPLCFAALRATGIESKLLTDTLATLGGIPKLERVSRRNSSPSATHSIRF